MSLPPLSPQTPFSRLPPFCTLPVPDAEYDLQCDADTDFRDLTEQQQRSEDMLREAIAFETTAARAGRNQLAKRPLGKNTSKIQWR